MPWQTLLIHTPRAGPSKKVDIFRTPWGDPDQRELLESDEVELIDLGVLKQASENTTTIVLKSGFCPETDTVKKDECAVNPA